MYTIIGLGNPGPRYEKTRHNVGHMVIDELVNRIGTKLSDHKQSNTRAASARLGVAPGAPGEQVILAVSKSYMNTSGGPVKALMNYFNAPVEGLIVVHDELDLPFGTLKLKRGGGEGGHNGLKSISQSLGTKDYIRLRFGVGRPPGRQDPADFVLGEFSATERKEMPFLISDAADAVVDILERGLETAQMRLHTA
ncbi:aminoacyl-tRNA hydrolase [Arcanobacterium bovis]|uniref:Peptidyl-tRNA hydrolase n=1 Tax=Arcanobacterium bovis TaxID=2529275 RepID=A0A4Q9V277_9ACTO|nr:aminoacyl-tRNA hydrolase [Arcanobacterium bovis]TBW23710.1 aminoacyl-tRNA hydrolase [Arcanobacterium bovis]